MTSARTNCSLTNSFQIQFQNLSTMNHKKTSCILLSCLFACKCIIQEVTLFSLLDLPSAEGGSFFRTDWLKTPHRWLNLTAIIIIHTFYKGTDFSLEFCISLKSF